MTLNLSMKNVDRILGNGGPFKVSKEGRIEVLKFDRSMQATVKVVLGINDDGNRMQDAFAMGDPESMGSHGRDTGIVKTWDGSDGQTGQI